MYIVHIYYEPHAEPNVLDSPHNIINIYNKYILYINIYLNIIK